MTIRVYNTLSKTKENFEPVVPGKVGIYLCGPTVYKESHIGHMVGPVIFDTIKRYLVYSGFEVTWVVNITDVDDKLIGQMHERGLPMEEIAEEMIVDYLNNLAALGVDQIDHMPKATEHMAGIIAFVQSLIDRGFAYAAGGDVFFEVGKDNTYGKLSNRSADAAMGEGGEASGKKRSAADFALWKSAKTGEPAWDSPWGKGRPGWHIECSAMSRAILGETFDIHGGGLDLLFPHHENELAQSECCHGKTFVKYWLHNGLLRAGTAGKIGGRNDREAAAGDASDASTVADTSAVAEAAAGKISRSKGGAGLADEIAKLGGERIRFFLLRSHYRSTVVFGPEAMDEASTSLEAFYRFFERYQRVAKQRFFNIPPIKRRELGEIVGTQDPLLATVAERRKSFLEKMDDDFNTGGAISDLFELIRDLNKFADQHKLDELEKQPPEVRLASKPLVIFQEATKTLRELTAILGLFRFTPAKRGGGSDGLVPSLMQLMIDLRAESRAKKDFAMGDRIRNGLTEMGITLEDRKGVTEWRAGGGA